MSKECVHDISNLLAEDPVLVQQKLKFYNLLSLPPGGFSDVEKQAGHDSYSFFNLSLQKLMTANGPDRLPKLVEILRKEGYKMTAEKVEARLKLAANYKFGPDQEQKCTFEFSGTSESKTKCQHIFLPSSTQFPRKLRERHNSEARIRKMFQSSQILNIVAPSGYGKSMLALSYAKNASYDYVLYFNGKSKKQLCISVRQVAVDLHIPAQGNIEIDHFLTLIYSKLEKQFCLHIFDDVNSELNIEQFLPRSQPPNVHILVLSLMKLPTSSTLINFGSLYQEFTTLELAPLTQERSLQFLCDQLKVDLLSEEQMPERRLLREVSIRLGCIPLAIDLIPANEYGSDLVSYLSDIIDNLESAMLEAPTASLRNLLPEYSISEAKALYVAFELALNHCFLKVRREDTFMQCANLLADLNNDDIDLCELRFCSGQIDKKMLDEYIQVLVTYKILTATDISEEHRYSYKIRPVWQKVLKIRSNDKVLPICLALPLITRSNSKKHETEGFKVLINNQPISISIAVSYLNSVMRKNLMMLQYPIMSWALTEVLKSIDNEGNFYFRNLNTFIIIEPHPDSPILSTIDFVMAKIFSIF